ncbi:MAG: hypothetical protein D6725_10285 [Planctomycetota bacterium]|nr:MAG: hypothetical protein D6725_10285 [Planctomycetota bacterium]
MAVRFAGSKHLHQRRRRLALKRGKLPADRVGDATPSPEEERERASVSPTANVPRVTPFERLIAPAPWRQLCVIVSIALCAGMVYLLRWDVLPTPLGEALQAVVPAEVLGPFAERLAVGVDVALLVLSAELMLLIWWVRSLSPKDFRGRYRVWGWAATTTVLIAAAIGTHAAPVLRAAVQGLASADDPRHVDWLWQLPAAVVTGAVGTSVLRDVRSDRLGRTALQGSFLLYVLAIMATHWYVFPRRVMQMLSTGFATGGHVLLFAGCLWHAHFVLYVSNDPPANGTSARDGGCDAPSEAARGRSASATTACFPPVSGSQ